MLSILTYSTDLIEMAACLWLMFYMFTRGYPNKVAMKQKWMYQPLLLSGLGWLVPAILGIPINFQPVFYIHLGLLHISLLLRVVADYANLFTLRMWGGLLNEAAILLFIIMTVLSIRNSLTHAN